ARTEEAAQKTVWFWCPSACGPAPSPSGLLQLLDFRRDLSHRARHHRPREPGAPRPPRSRPARQRKIRSFQSRRLHPRDLRLVQLALTTEPLGFRFALHMIAQPRPVLSLVSCEYARCGGAAFPRAVVSSGGSGSSGGRNSPGLLVF